MADTVPDKLPMVCNTRGVTGAILKCLEDDMQPSLNSIFKLAGAVLLAAATSTAFAQTLPKPFLAYDDGLANGWQNWSWAKVQLEFPIPGGKPIQVKGDPWSALLLHHDPFSTSGFTKLTFLISGGASGGQLISVKAMMGGKALDSSFQIQPKAKTWLRVEVPLKDINAMDKMIDSICLQGAAEAYPAYYVTKIQFE